MGRWLWGACGAELGPCGAGTGPWGACGAGLGAGGCRWGRDRAFGHKPRGVHRGPWERGGWLGPWAAPGEGCPWGQPPPCAVGDPIYPLHPPPAAQARQPLAPAMGLLSDPHCRRALSRLVLRLNTPLW